MQAMEKEGICILKVFQDEEKKWPSRLCGTNICFSSIYSFVEWLERASQKSWKMLLISFTWPFNAQCHSTQTKLSQHGTSHLDMERFADFTLEGFYHFEPSWAMTCLLCIYHHHQIVALKVTICISEMKISLKTHVLSNLHSKCNLP